MLRLVTAEREVTAVNSRLRAMLADGSSHIKTTLGMPGGSGPALLYWRPDGPLWACFEKRENRYWNAFGFEDPTDGRQQAPVCEINVRLRGVDQQVGAAYAIDDETNAVFVLHNGKIGGGKKGVGKALFWKRYANRPTVKVEHEGRHLTYAVVANLDDSEAVKDIARFVYLVDHIRAGKSFSKAGLASFGASTPTYPREQLFLLCPASGDALLVNLQKSIERPLSKRALSSSFPNLSTELAKTSSGDVTWAWGLRRGSSNDRTWQRLQAGDEVALFTSNELRYYARVTHKINSKELADSIWGPDAEGRSLSQTIFLTEPSPISVPLSLFNDLLAYEFDRSPQGTFILDLDRATALRRHIGRLVNIQPNVIADLITIRAQTHPDSSQSSLDDLLFGKDVAPPLKPYSQSAFEEPVPWDVQLGVIDATKMLQKLERRSKQHNAIVSTLAEVLGAQERSVEYSDYIDLLVDRNIIIEVKTLSANPVRQVRAALGQLFHYRFAYREQIVSPQLVAVFSAPLSGPYAQLVTFLNDCGIGTAWMSGDDLRPDVLAEQILFSKAE